MSVYYAAVDPHSNQSVLVVIDEKDRPVWKGRFRNDLELVLLALAPYRDNWQPLGKRCHDRKTGKEGSGFVKTHVYW